MKLTIVGLILLTFSLAPAQQPSMDETVEWLQSKSPQIRSVAGNTPRESVESKSGKWEFGFIQPCTLELKNGDQKNVPPKQKRGTITDTPRINTLRPPQEPSTITIPLSSLNPQKVNLVSTSIFSKVGTARSDGLLLGTTDNKAAIIWKGPDITLNLTSLAIGLNEVGLAERLQKAFLHAVNNCGGKPDKKEPF